MLTTLIWQRQFLGDQPKRLSVKYAKLSKERLLTSNSLLKAYKGAESSENGRNSHQTKHFATERSTILRFGAPTSKNGSYQNQTLTETEKDAVRGRMVLQIRGCEYEAAES